ncbi:MAG: VWA domain-containing protein [Planctomycetes bacterium]|nr:VWA domain-containing protein [Planctomycetota bacterium]
MVKHAVVLDVSGSMESRRPELDQFIENLLGNTELPPNHMFVGFELSDALRPQGSVHGLDTRYRSLGDLTTVPDINGEIIVVTDGQGPLEDLYADVDPRRLVLLRAPSPVNPDAAVVLLSAPTSVVNGSTAFIRGIIRCDTEVEAVWHLYDGNAEVANSTVKLRAGVPFIVTHVLPVYADGLVRVRLTVDVKNDREPRNDEAATSILIGDSQQIIYCSPGVGENEDALLSTLRSVSPERVSLTKSLPLLADELEGVGLVIINNLSLAQSGATAEQLKTLADWVSGGGNLMMVGTDGAFGPGGYRGTLLEPLMPVKFRPDDSPPRQLLLLLDVSSSMNDSLPGGGSKLARLKEGALRVVEAAGENDRVAVVAFREGIRGDIKFYPARDPRLLEAINGLDARGSTHIGSALQQSLTGFSSGEHNGILMITDGDDVENAGQAAFEGIAQQAASKNLRFDFVLTAPGDRAWIDWITKHSSKPDAHLWSVGNAGFDGLLETLEHALAGQDIEWILNEPLSVSGVNTDLPKLVRTAPRSGPGTEILLKAVTQDSTPSEYPLLATRQLIGRTSCLCTDSWGDIAMGPVWRDAGFQRQVGDALQFMLESAGQTNLVLNPLKDGQFELVWTGNGAPPDADLTTDTDQIARRVSTGRWLLDSPTTGAELRVYDNQRLLQRIPLPDLVTPELRYTGDDAPFFELAAESGIRVFTSLGAWQPRRFVESTSSPDDYTWLPALLASICVVGGFWLRQKRS